MVSGQLERKNIHPFNVVRRCGGGFPTVIQCEPVADAEPAGGGAADPAGVRDAGTWGRGAADPVRVFTTLYWLTCPEMVRHISRFESEGWIPRLEKAVAAAPAVAEGLKDLHGRYANLRRRLVGRRRMERLKKLRPRIAESIESAGVAGVSDTGGRAHIKCLHAHAAYHMVHGDHPIFLAFPELVKNLDGCRTCEKFRGKYAG